MTARYSKSKRDDIAKMALLFAMTVDDYRHSVFGLAANERVNIRQPGDWLELSTDPNLALAHEAPSDVPNRLHGAFIKEDGDAA